MPQVAPQLMNTEANTLPVWFIVIAWAALSLILNALGVFTAHPNQPPFALLTAIIGPPILFLIAYASSANLRTRSLRLDLRLLTAMQGWRVIGAICAGRQLRGASFDDFSGQRSAGHGRPSPAS